MPLRLLALFTLIAAWPWAVGAAAAERVRPERLPINEPVQVTADAEPVAEAAVSADGKWLVYAAGRDGFRDLWFRSADPSRVVLPRRLTDDPGSEFAPALSADGRWIAYVGTGHDAKGDIYLLQREGAQPPQRLTGREAEDGAPAFSPDGGLLYFHRVRPRDRHPRLFIVDLRSKGPPQAVETGGDGAFPAVSPDGSRVAFVSRRSDPGGDLFLLDRASGRVAALTSGPALDAAPFWAPDGSAVYFSRRFLDTDRDGRVTPRDAAVAYRLPLDGVPQTPSPLTPASYSAERPKVAGPRLLFLSPRGGVTNVWSIPAGGVIPSRDTPEEQLELATRLSKRLPPDPALAVLGYEKVLERFPKATPGAARAALEIGRLYARMGHLSAAAGVYARVFESYSAVQPEAALARVQLAVLRTRGAWSAATSDRDRRHALGAGVAELEELSAGDSDPWVKARAAIEKARLLTELGRDAAALGESLDALERVIESREAPPDAAAEAMVLRADAYARVGRSEQVVSAYLAALERFPEEDEQADHAVRSLVDLSDDASQPHEQRVQTLRRLAEENRRRHPRLAAGALNRVGDLWYSADEWARAKAAYRQVLDDHPGQTTQAAAARLALAEILYREERFRQALDLYETEIRGRATEDRIYRLARQGYVRKSLEAGEFLYRSGEVASAGSLFKDLIRYDDSVVEAHRGYIKAAAAQGRTQEVLAEYRRRLQREPNAPLALYATGLSLTYLQGKQRLEEARSMIERAIAQRGQVEYFHQTLGYIFEVLETVHDQGGGLEQALESYRKAYFLNDHERNPANAANLLLNLGNGYSLLGQQREAFDHYRRRLALDVPFDDPDTEILFFRRFGVAAFQARESLRAVELFEKALELVRSGSDPKKASAAYDALNRAVLDRFLARFLEAEAPQAEPERLAARQSELRARLFRLTQAPLAAVPSREWEVYRQGVEELVTEQEAINPEVVAWLRGAGVAADEVETADQTLELLTSRVRSALAAPLRLAQLEAEMLDRLGLARQEAGLWEAAAAVFEEGYAQSERLGLNRNLARNRRSVAFNTYQLAGASTGGERRRLLRKAARDFEAAIALVREHGVPERESEPGAEGGALVAIRVEVPLDEVAATQAAFGFTAEQEEGLAQAFLARIHLELGELERAEAALRAQLTRYPPERPIADADLYGVALLHHRAGLVAFAQGRPEEAFRAFARSAALTQRLGTAASTAVNVADMARALAALAEGKGPQGIAPLVTELERADRQAARLLARTPAVSRQPIAGFFHNALGLFWLTVPSVEEGLAGQVFRARALAGAIAHFNTGLQLFGEPGAVFDRGRLALAARLHWNRARAADELGESGQEDREAALGLAERALLPDLQWRALAGLGRLEEGLAALETVLPLRAHCAPGEITGAFAPLIEDRLAAGEVEETFDLAERLAELERVHRLAPLTLGELPPGERVLFRQVYPRLLRIRDLGQRAGDAAGEERAYLAESLGREKKLLAADLGERRERLPDLAARAGSEEAQNITVILLGLALHAEEVADSVVREPSAAAERIQEYRELVEQFERVRRAAVARRSAGEPGGVLALLGPEPAGVVDVVENLPADEILFRVVRVADGYLAFRVAADGIETLRAADAEGLEGLVESLRAPVYLVHEDPSLLPDRPGAAYALSATHWFRSFQARKPFKRALLSVPPDKAGVGAGFELVSIPPPPESGDVLEPVIEAMQFAHTLLLQGPVGVAASVPTRERETPTSRLALALPTGRRLALDRLVGRLPRASLAVVAGADRAATYPAGHLLSLAGCPTVLLGREPNPESVEVFLAAYETRSAADAAQTVEPDQRAGWRLLGYRGMAPEEARAFAEARFVRYVQDAQQAFQQGRPVEALATAEDALAIAREATAFERYLPDLYRFAREAAYAAERTETAARYGGELADQIAKTRPDTQAHADALLRLGLLLTRLERYEEAVATLEQAAEILANLELGEGQVQALAGMGIALENATEYDRALATFESAATRSRELDLEGLLARQQVNLGRIYDLRLSRWALARQKYQEAVSLYDGVGDLRGVIQGQLDVGRCHRLLGNFPEADRLYAQALELLKEEPDPVLRAKVTIEQANNAWFQARYQVAFDLQRQVLQSARELGWDLGQVIALNTSGLIWWTLGDNDRALRELTKALDLARTLEARDDEVATTLNNIGLVYREMGRYGDALETLNRALAIDRRLQSRWAIAYDLRNLGLTYLRSGETVRAIDLLWEAATEASAIGDRVNEAKALSALGEAQLTLGDGADAARSFGRALELSRSMALRETEWRALHGLAQVELGAEKREAARDLLFEAVEVVEGMRADIKLEQLRDGFLTNKVAVYEALVSVLVDLGDPVAAFEVAERSRSRNFIDLLGNQRLSLLGAADQELYDRQRAVKVRLEEQSALLAQARTEEERTAYRTALEGLRDEQRDLLLEMQARNPELAALVSVDPVDVERMKALLEPGTALLAYYLVPGEILCWVIDAETVSLVRTPVRRAELEEAVFDYRRLIQNLEPLRGASKELHRLLLEPVGAATQGKRYLGIVPHGSLHYLSFATVFDGENHLIDDFSLFYLPSASVLKYTLERRNTGANRRVLAIGNPDLGDAALELPFAEQEVGSMRWNFPDLTLLTGERATESWVTEHLGEFGIIHLASHGEFDPVNPLFSAIKLTRDVRRDGNLQAAEVFELEINADLVVLSACQTGLGEVTRGDDVIGLNRAFFYAGTHTILSSLWRVSDVSTALLMKHFYRRYATGNKADSLRAAMLHVKNRYPHPGYWGAFTLSGDYE